MKRYSNGFSIGRLSFYRWRDRQTLRSLRSAWRLGDVQKGISLPIVGTKYTMSWR